MNYATYEKKVEAWISEFGTNTRNLGVKLLNGLGGDVWEAGEEGGTEGLKAEDGWRVLLSRVKHDILSKGETLQGELLESYTKTPSMGKQEEGEQLHARHCRSEEEARGRDGVD